MENQNIIKLEELNDAQKNEYVDLFFEGFGHLFNFKKDKEKYKELFKLAFHPQYSYAFVQDNEVQGMLLLATNKLRPIKLNEEFAISLFGKFKGSVMCKQINAMFQSKVVSGDNDLYIEMLGVSKKAARQGIGTKLLNFAFSQDEFDTYYLEVLSKNIIAKTLYEKLGFKVIKKDYFAPVSFLGHGYSIKMKKTLD